MSEYSQFVDYRKIGPFKAAMRQAAQKTFTFPNKRGVYVDTDLAHSHGGVWSYEGAHP